MFGLGKLIVLTSYLVNPLSGVLPMCCAGLAVSKYWPAVPLVPSERPQPFTAVGWVQVGPRAKGGSPPVPSERPQPFACVRAVGWAQVGPHILPPSATFPRTAPQYCSHWARGAGVWLSTARKPCTLSIQKKQSSTFPHPPSPLRDTLGAFAPAMRPTATLMQQEEELESLATPTEDDDTVTAAAATHEVHAPGKVRKTRKLHLRTCSRRHPLAALPRLRPCFLSGAPCRGLGHGGGILVGLGRR